MQQIKRVIFTVGILSVITTGTAAHAKLTFAATTSTMRLLASRWTPDKNALRFEKNVIAGHHARLADPNQAPNTTPIEQHLKDTGKRGVTPASLALIDAAASTSGFFISYRSGSAIVSSTDAKRQLASNTTPHEKVYVAAIVNRAVEPINIIVPTSVDDIHG